LVVAAGAASIEADGAAVSTVTSRAPAERVSTPVSGSTSAASTWWTPSDSDPAVSV
jgi:hypothetical protein